VKTTLEIPDELFRSAKARAAEEGVSLKAYVVEALRAKLKSAGETDSKPWMKHFGSLSHLRKETRRIEKIIEDEFETINPEDWK
jgi:plasmid stability protein